MEYAVGRQGRIIVARLSEGEELYECVEGMAKKENIRAAAVFITGGFRKAEVVVGPKGEKPIVPDFKSFDGPGEALGVGTLYIDDAGVTKMHLHAAMGKKDQVVVGCPRGGANTFLILEVTIIEIEGVDAVRTFDASSGVKLLKITK